MKSSIVAAAATVAAALSAGLAARAEAQQCAPSRLEIILDKSSSMQTGTIGGVPKWSIARDALGTVAGEFEDTLELGLMTFPEPDQCAPGAEQVAPALRNREAIMAELAGSPPISGNWTPLAQTLTAAAALPSLSQADVARYAVVVSDGWQWCSPYDPTTRFDSIDALAALNGAGVTTFVVGFGDSVDALTLNGLAVAAGTARPGCDPSGDSPNAASPCYYQADDSDELIDALREIAGDAATETCDGEDNDCDGLVDEDLVRDCATDCGSGSETCVGGDWTGCDAPQPEVETCDGDDNDCDGTTDPGCDCNVGAERACGGEDCGAGIQTCRSDGTWGGCEDDPAPGSEMCDGVDNDCDGEIDEFDGTDDVGSLCDAGEQCQDGDCVSGDPGIPPDENGAEDPAGAPEGTVVGCGCRTGSPSAGLGGLLLCFAAALIARRRR